MEVMLSKLRGVHKEKWTFESLGDFVHDLKVEDLVYKTLIPEMASDQVGYARNILAMEPLEVVLLHWPGGVESAVHEHRGFWGYVLCLEGVMENVDYSLHDGTVREKGLTHVMSGGIMPEPDGTIHKLVNSSPDKPLITLHFYAPALESLEGLRLFDLKAGDIYVCHDETPSATLGLADEMYGQILRNQFDCSYSKYKSHELAPIVPMPAREVVQELVQAYYNEQAEIYDANDQAHFVRKRYTTGINGFVAENLRIMHARNSLISVLDVACGTGRRATEIRDLTEVPYALYGTDASSEMREQARLRGISVVQNGQEPDGWLNKFDVVTMLYAFGHLVTESDRMVQLQRMHRMLKPGGVIILDAFNIGDSDEWGPEVVELHESLRLSEQGYKAGDMFYQRAGSKASAFIHYYSKQELENLINVTGFELETFKQIGYNQSPGELLECGGNHFIVASKRIE